MDEVEVLDVTSTSGVPNLQHLVRFRMRNGKHRWRAPIAVSTLNLYEALGLHVLLEFGKICWDSFRDVEEQCFCRMEY